MTHLYSLYVYSDPDLFIQKLVLIFLNHWMEEQ